MNLADMLKTRAAASPDHPAILFECLTRGIGKARFPTDRQIVYGLLHLVRVVGCSLDRVRCGALAGVGCLGLFRVYLEETRRRNPEGAAAQLRVEIGAACQRCGRPRGYIRRFGLCRICFREIALQGKIPGVTKSSW